jgi:hypothetical protein
MFKKVVLRPTDTRREIIRALKRVELFKCLNLGQLQRLTDLLHEAEYKRGDYIIRQGEMGDAFYIIVGGRCDCIVDIPMPPMPPSEEVTEGAETLPSFESKVVMQLKVP